MKKTYIIGAAIAIMAAATWFAMRSGAGALDNRPVVKIGLIASLSGNNAEIGHNVKRVLQQYIKENDSRFAVRYWLVVEDDGGRARSAPIIVQKLADVDRVSGIITMFTYAGMAAAPIVAQKGVPHINVGSNPDVVDGKFSFLNYTAPQVLIEKLMDLLASRGYKNLAMAYMDHVGPAPYVREIKRTSAARGIKYFDYPYDPNERDFRAILADIAKVGPDVVVLMALPPSMDIFRKQMIEAGLGDMPITSVNFLNAARQKELFEGVVFVDSPDGGLDFIRRVRGGLGIDNLFLLAFAEDSLAIFIKIVEEYWAEHGRAPSRLTITEGVRGLRGFHGAAGTYDMGADGVGSARAVFKQIKGGKVAVIEN